MNSIFINRIDFHTLFIFAARSKRATTLTCDLMHTQIQRTLLAFVALAATSFGCAHAAISVGAGLTSSGGTSQTTSNTGSAAFVLSSATNVPLLPVDYQGSVFVQVGKLPGYIATGELRTTFGSRSGFYLGAGVGYGSLSDVVPAVFGCPALLPGTTCNVPPTTTVRSSGSTETVFLGKSIAPRTTFEARYYHINDAFGTQAGFAGIRFSL